MIIQLKQDFPSPKYSDSEEYLKKQQKIDVALILVKTLEPNLNVTQDFVIKARNKLNSLLDEL